MLILDGANNHSLDLLPDINLKNSQMFTSHLLPQQDDYLDKSKKRVVINDNEEVI
jgi:hypothetical protein